MIQTKRDCEHHGRVSHGREWGEWQCIRCAVERLASMQDAARDVRGRLAYELRKMDVNVTQCATDWTDVWDARDKG